MSDIIFIALPIILGAIVALLLIPKDDVSEHSDADDDFERW